jgi:ketol-acid reductoisomerase (EC 1.1.1.86)
MAAKIHTDKDADLKQLKGKTVAVIGFGSQGHAHALNLKESGVKVIIGLYPGSKSRAVAKKQGFAVFNTAEAVKQADIIFIAVPDTKIAAVYEKEIAPHLTAAKTLLFSHGFAIHFKTITPPKNIDVIMVAPEGTRAHCPPSIQRRPRRPDAHRGLPKPEQAGQKDRFGLGQRHWRDEGRRARDHLQGRNRNGPFRRAGRTMRWRFRAGSGWV